MRTKAYYDARMKALFGSLGDNPIDVGTETDFVAGTEGMVPDISAAWYVIRDAFLNKYTAMRRFYQSLTQGSNSAISRLQFLRTRMNRLKSLPDMTMFTYSSDDIAAWIKAKPDQVIDRALQALHDMQSWGFQDAIEDTAEGMVDMLERDIEHIENSEIRKNNLSVKRDLKVPDIIRAIDYALILAKEIVKANTEYDGWWKTGFNQGKLPVIYSALSPVAGLGSAIAMLITLFMTHRNTYRAARESWRNINTTSNMSMTYIEGVIRMCDRILKEVE